jgi:hypothetical protein
VRELLKETIINNLREADNRANEALEKDLAKAQLQKLKSEN